MQRSSRELHERRRGHRRGGTTTSNVLAVEEQMKICTALTLAALTFFATNTVSAAEVAMRRVLSCEGPDAKMEVYLPEAVVIGRGIQNVKVAKPIIGAYSLDLTAAGKGKSLEPIRVLLSRDRKSVIIDQYTRKLPPTAIAVVGATVNFDQRFGTGAKCGPFNEE
jgi:hypothetical protein